MSQQDNKPSTEINDEMIVDFYKKHFPYAGQEIGVIIQKWETFKAQASGREEKWKTASVQKKPLFTTEDGKDVVDGDNVYYVDLKDYSNSIIFNVVGTDILRQYPTYKYFSTEQAAQEYIFLNKPVLSVKDILGISKIEMDTFGQFTVQRLKQIAESKIKERRDK